MLIAVLILTGIIGASVYVIYIFDTSLPDRSFNYYEMKEYHRQNIGFRKKWWWLISFLRL
jgi:hypothetical protein